LHSFAGPERARNIALGAAADTTVEAEAQLSRAIDVARQYSLPFVEANALDTWAWRLSDPARLDAAGTVLERIGAQGDWITWLAAGRAVVTAR
jgi:hypothetical protein